jgi:glycerol-1-phosphate dehydrogenase [NAD(P)+]
LHGLDYRYYRSLLKRIGFPTTLDALGVDKETFMQAIAIAPQTFTGRYTILSEVTPELLEEAYNEVYGVGSSINGEFSSQD